MKVEQEIDIAAAPERVYETVMDPRQLGEWVTIHLALEEAPDGELREGSRMIQSLRLAGQRVRVRWIVVEADAPVHVVWEGRGPVRTRARVVYEFQATAEGTRFSYLNEYTGGPLARLAGRALARTSARESERSLEQLKALLER